MDLFHDICFNNYTIYVRVNVNLYQVNLIGDSKTDIDIQFHVNDTLYYTRSRRIL